MGCIYKIENTVNGKCYVGQTGNWKKRNQYHLSYLKRNKHHNQHLQSSWNKYGESAFTFTVLVDDLPEKYMDDMERGFIATFRTIDKKYGYNKESGGNTNKKHSLESIEKNSQSKLKWYADGNVHPMQGKKISPEQVEANRQRKLKWYADGNTHPMQGRKQSPESIEKSRQANLGKRYSPATEFKKGEHRSRTTEFKKGTIPLNKCPLLDSNGATWPSLSSVILVLGGSLSCLSTAIKNNKPFKGLYFTKIEPIQIQQSI